MEMGTGDLPLFIEKIIEVRRNDKKVVFLGLGTGNTELFWALTQMEEDFFADKLDRAIMMAPCMFVGPTTFQEYLDMDQLLEKMGRLSLLSNLGVKSPVKNQRHHW